MSADSNADLKFCVFLLLIPVLEEIELSKSIGRALKQLVSDGTVVKIGKRYILTENLTHEMLLEAVEKSGFIRPAFSGT